MRLLRNFREFQSSPGFFERVLASVNYVTFGIAGFVWLILAALKKVRLTRFLQYHIFQTFFLVMLYWLAGVFISLVVQILSFVPIVNKLVLKILFLFNTPFIFEHYSIISGTICCIIIYLCITSLQGRYSYIPWVSDIIEKNVR